MTANFGMAVFLMASSAWQTDMSKTTPSLSYWNISLQILMKPRLAADLGVSKEQCDRLREMRSSDRFSKLFSAELQKNDELEIVDIEWILDDEVQRALSNILTATQLSNCREKCLVARLPTVRTIFSDAEVLEYLRLDDQQRVAFEKSLVKHLADQDAAVTELGKTSAKKVLDILPLSSHQKFADYIGIDQSLSLLPTPGLKFEDVPFPSICASGSILHYLPTADSVSLSKKQKLELDAIASKRDSQLTEYSGNDVRGFVKTLQLEVYEAMTGVLTPQQHVLLSQHYSRMEFLSDVALPFKRPAFVQYLNMGNKQEEVLEFAITTSESSRKSFQEFEATLFHKVVIGLPKDAQSRIRKLFPSRF